MQTVADLVQILDEQHKLVVQPASALGNFPGILALTLLFPEAVDHAKRRQQCGRADNHDLAVERLLEQSRLALERRSERCLDGHEQQDEVQAVQALEAFVILAREAFDVVADRQHVLLECGLRDCRIVTRGVLLKGRKADLGVDHHLAIAGQHDQYVGLEALAIGALETDLGLVFATFLQACVLKHALKNQFAPVALGFLPLESLGEVFRLIAQTQVELLQALQLLGQGEALAGLLLIAFLDALLERLDALFERIEQLPQALLTVFSKPLLALIEDLASQLGELCA